MSVEEKTKFPKYINYNLHKNSSSNNNVLIRIILNVMVLQSSWTVHSALWSGRMKLI